METFEINSLLRLLRTSLKSTSSLIGANTNPTHSSSSCINFINSGQRLEALKSLRRQLHRQFSPTTSKKVSAKHQPISSSLVHSILETLRQILSQLVSEYFGNTASVTAINSTIAAPSTDVIYRQINGTLKPIAIKPLTVDSVFAAAVRRNEILEIIQIVLQLIQRRKTNKSTIFTPTDSTFHYQCHRRQSHHNTPSSFGYTSHNNNDDNSQIKSVDSINSGRLFLPEVIALLGHESSDVQRYSIRFLLVYLSRTNNLQRLLQTFVRYGLDSPNHSVQFGTLNALPHLFIRDEFAAENLSPLVQALGRLLLRSQTTNRHLFYPTYVSLERLNALLGIHRFYAYWRPPDGATSSASRSTSAAIALYENLQKRAPSPHIFINCGTSKTIQGYNSAAAVGVGGGGGLAGSGTLPPCGRYRCGDATEQNTTNQDCFYKDNNNNNHHHHQFKLGQSGPEEEEEEDGQFDELESPEDTATEEHYGLEDRPDDEDEANENDNFQEGDNDTVIDGATGGCQGGGSRSIVADGARSGGVLVTDPDGTVRYNTNDSIHNNIGETCRNPNANQNINQNNNYYYQVQHQNQEACNYYYSNTLLDNSNLTPTCHTAGTTLAGSTSSAVPASLGPLHPRTATSCCANRLNLDGIEMNLNSKASRRVCSKISEGEECLAVDKDEDNRDDGKLCANSGDSAVNDSAATANNNATTTTTTSISVPRQAVATCGQSQAHHVTWSTSIVAIASSGTSSDGDVSSTSPTDSDSKLTGQVKVASVSHQHQSSSSSQSSESSSSTGNCDKPLNLCFGQSVSSSLNEPYKSGPDQAGPSGEGGLPANCERDSCDDSPPQTTDSTTSTNSEMATAASASAAAASYAPGLAGYAQLDADSLANLDYIPTLKDYYPYLHSYGYDPLYSLASNPLPSSVITAAAVAAGGHVPIFPHHHHPALPLAAHPIDRHHLLRFGIFPRVLIYQSLSSIADEQFAAVQAIVRIVRDAPHEHLLLLIPHLDEFLTAFVSQLLLNSASNFKVILWTLDIVELLSERLQHRLHPFLSQIVLLLSRRLGDNRIVIRDSVIKVFHQMMHRYSAQEMIDLLFKHVSSSGQHTHSLAFTSAAKLREEMANRITATVSTFPRGQLNLPKLCFDVVPFLVDRRSLVRLASLECVATLAQALGPHKLGSLMTAVHSLDTCLTTIDHDRLVAAIQARLARRSLPRTGPDGNVQYVLRVPNTGETQAWYYRRIYDADLEWIALGPTTPLPVGTGLVPASVSAAAAANLPISCDPDDLMPATASSEESTSSDQIAQQQQSKMALDEERLARQDLIKSADSEDIPPPVKGQSVHTNHDPEGQHKSKCIMKPIDASSMSQDQHNQIRDFSDSQQQYEMEARTRSLERSRTVQDYYSGKPYGSYYCKKQDALLERFMRGESIDDSDLPDAQILRKSSVESLEAWRQYFGRFKKQLAEIALTGGGGVGGIGNRYGSRPGSGVFYGSPLPLPSYGLSPSYYYHYYCNGLSHSYHDLSQLQQQNMLSIMKRSGFMTSEDDSDQQKKQRKRRDSGAKADPSKRQQSISPERDSVGKASSLQQRKMSKSEPGSQKQHTKSQAAKQRRLSKQESTKSVTPTSSDSNKQKQSYTPFDLAESASMMPGMERSLSMPAIGPGGLVDQMENNGPGPGVSGGGQNGPIGQGSDQEMISDEVIQELGMWEQVIQDEKKENKESAQSAMEREQEERDQVARTEEEEQMAHSDYEEDRNNIADSSEPAQANRRISVVPVVNIQPTSPQSPSVRFEDEEGQRTTTERTRRQQSYEQDSQQGSDGELADHQDQNDEDNQPDSDQGQKLSQEEEEEEQQEDQEEEQEEETQQEPEQAQHDSQVSDVRRSSKCAAESSNIPASVKPSAPPAPPSITRSNKTQPKSRIPAVPAPARRLSRIPQQLYIKTTPAIPMNANIQHILTNVARTEGPFDYPADAVKAALIAMHDNAWTTKVEGMLAVVRLATFHPNYLHRDQHQIALSLVNETRNLRSTVSRSAIFTIGELFAKLKSQIEPEMDILIQALLYKVGENSIFIREDIDRALALMINSMPQTRAAISLITYGSNHRNTFVRRTSAQFLSALVEKMGAMKCLLGPRDIGEHLLPAAARFIQEGSPHTRYFGRRIFAVLMQHPLFEKLLRKNVSPGTYRNICGMLETIRRRGIGDRPADLYTPAVQPKEHDPRRLVVVGGGTDAK